MEPSQALVTLEIFDQNVLLLKRQLKKKRLNPSGWTLRQTLRKKIKKETNKEQKQTNKNKKNTEESIKACLAD